MNTSKKTLSSELTDADVDRVLDEALAAEPKDIKVHVSLRLDSDIYMKLKDLAAEGAADGKYQTLISRILRAALFPTKQLSQRQASARKKVSQGLVNAQPLKKVRTYVAKTSSNPKKRTGGKSAKVTTKPGSRATRK